MFAHRLSCLFFSSLFFSFSFQWMHWSDVTSPNTREEKIGKNFKNEKNKKKETISR
jgi:hypothetical protein